MRIDATKGSMHVLDIIVGLSEIEKHAFRNTSDPYDKFGLIALKTGCEVFRQLTSQDAIFDVPFRNQLVRDCVLHVVASMDIVRSFENIPTKQHIKVAREHLRLIGSGYFGVAATAINQNNKTNAITQKLIEIGIAPLSADRRADASRKTIELMLILASLCAFDSVLIEDPIHSDAANPNPDLIIHWNGNRYGIACKSVASHSLETLRERIAEGIEQLSRCTKSEKSINKIDKYRGILFIDLSPILDHELLYAPMDHSCFWDIKLHGEILKNELSKKLTALREAKSEMEAYGYLFKESVVAPCVIFYAHGLMICTDGRRNTPLLAKIMTKSSFGDMSFVNSFIERLNLSLHGQCEAQKP